MTQPPRSTHPRAPTNLPTKAERADQCETLEQIPNIGFALAADLRNIGIAHPRDLLGRNGFALYLMLCRQNGLPQDPCVLDCFLAACDFMQGAPAKPWWHYTVERKARYGLALKNLFDEAGLSHLLAEEPQPTYHATHSPSLSP